VTTRPTKTAQSALHNESHSAAAAAPLIKTLSLKLYHFQRSQIDMTMAAMCGREGGG